MSSLDGRYRPAPGVDVGFLPTGGIGSPLELI
ncbi:MAG: hypothetical protein JWQ95_3611 [Sphaerisporangium sp.]|nr:hypothetical protein [Sphaerisporangium sp.]